MSIVLLIFMIMNLNVRYCTHLLYFSARIIKVVLFVFYYICEC